MPATRSAQPCRQRHAQIGVSYALSELCYRANRQYRAGWLPCGRSARGLIGNSQGQTGHLGAEFLGQGDACGLRIG